MATSNRKRNTRLTGVRSIAGFFAAGVAAVAASLMVGVTTAAAHHPIIEASVTCQGTVSYTATAWLPTDGNILERINPDVRISYQEWGTGAKIPVGAGAFTEANGFSFSGAFPYPDGIGKILVWADAVGLWGNGYSGGSWAVWVDQPGTCGSTTSSSTTSTSSSTSTSTSTSTTTSTTAPSSSSSSTSTTTTQVGGESSTTSTTLVDAESSTTSVAGGGGNLPSTGVDTGRLSLLAIGLTCFGISAVLATRRRTA
jgi:LPXTG-motif cell wall-anchored protein